MRYGSTAGSPPPIPVGPRRSLAEYYAPFGWYEGRIHTDVDISVDGMFGMGEQ